MIHTRYRIVVLIQRSINGREMMWVFVSVFATMIYYERRMDETIGYTRAIGWLWLIQRSINGGGRMEFCQCASHYGLIWVRLSLWDGCG